MSRSTNYIPSTAPAGSSAVVPASRREAGTEGDPPTTGPERRAEHGCQLRVLHSIRRIIRSVDLYSKQLSGCHGITVPQLVALLAVCEHGSLTVTGLGKLVHVSPSTLIGVVDRLEEKGLVVRERSGRDRRLVHLYPTEAGMELARSSPSPLQQGLVEALDALPEDEQAMLASALERIVDLMETGRLGGVPVPEAADVGVAESAFCPDETTRLEHEP